MFQSPAICKHFPEDFWTSALPYPPPPPHLLYGLSQLLLLVIVDEDHLPPVKVLQQRHQGLGDLRVVRLGAGKRGEQALVGHVMVRAKLQQQPHIWGTISLVLLYSNNNKKRNNTNNNNNGNNNNNSAISREMFLTLYY